MEENAELSREEIIEAVKQMFSYKPIQSDSSKKVTRYVLRYRKLKMYYTDYDLAVDGYQRLKRFYPRCKIFQIDITSKTITKKQIYPNL